MLPSLPQLLLKPSQKPPGETVDIYAYAGRKIVLRDGYDLVAIFERDTVAIYCRHCLGQGGSHCSGSAGGSVAAYEMIDDDRIGYVGEASEKPVRIGDGQERRDGYDGAEAGCAKFSCGFDSPLYCAGRFGQGFNLIAVGFYADVKSKFGAFGQFWVEIQIIADLRAMGLQDQKIRRVIQHRLQEAARDAMFALGGLKGFGRTGHEDSKAASLAPGPGALTLILLQVDFGCVGSSFDKGSPGAAARDVNIMTDVTTDAA